MSPTTESALGIAATSLAALVIGCAAIWGGLALWYRAPGGRHSKALSTALWGAFSLAMQAALWQHQTVGLIGFAAAFAGLLLWWVRIRPQSDHDWADDVARITAGTVIGNRVTLRDVRNFDWRTRTDYTQCWETRIYDLERLRSVDMVMSYWRGPAIAHMVTSFGFEDGAHVVFTVEIRRRKTQTFSEIGGFFKEFELTIMACDERDAIRLRTNVRREEAYMFRLQLAPEAMRAMFLGYIGEANRLVESPRFYHTITVNCTTLVYQMMSRIVGHLPLDYRLLFSGYMPQYVYAVGGLDRRYTLAELRERGRITLRARESDRSPHFSADIRRGLPGVERLNRPSRPPAARWAARV